MRTRWWILVTTIAACAAPATTPATKPATTSVVTSTVTSMGDMAGSAPTAASLSPPDTAATEPPTIAASPSSTVEPGATTAAPKAFARPDWLGTRVLPVGANGFGEVQPTPPELAPRRLETVDVLPPPATTTFASTSGPVPDDVLARSTWAADCPVGREDLSYLTMSHVGFDGELHTGEMIVHRRYQDSVIEIFERLFEAGYPIEEMRVIDRPELDAPPTGDGNVTTSFVCRPAVGTSAWSQHAYGLAIDINPFHNPYRKGELILPELAGWYVDRTRTSPGMIDEDSVAVRAFDELGWGWGGRWTTIKDWMHFSENGR